MESKKNMQFIDHGIAAPVVESRTAAVCVNQDGETRVVIAAKGFMLIVDPVTEHCQQVYFPVGVDDYPFASYSSQGLFYTGAGPLFIVLDPFKGKIIYHTKVPGGEEIACFRLTSDISGNIYFASYPSCWLYRYDPRTDHITDFGRLDSEQKYVGHLAVDQDGWIYAGVGTAKCNLVAFRPETEELHSFLSEEERWQGSGYVHLGQDGQVYGHWDSPELHVADMAGKEYRWKRFCSGRFEEVEAAEVSPSFYSGFGFFLVQEQKRAPFKVARHDLAERELVLIDKQNGMSKIIPLQYDCQGAKLSPLIGTPNGYVYGTSNHPLHFFSYHPETKQLVDYGGQIVSGGNICAYDVQGSCLGGATYPDGGFHLFDLTRPFELGEPSSLRNPKRVTQQEAIARPRCVLAHSDGEHFIYGGFAGYGAVGGALGLYHIHNDKLLLIPNEDVVRFESVVCLGELSNGDVIGGTSIETPGGAEPKAETGSLFRMDWRSKEVIQTWTPVEGAREISLLQCDEQGRVHALTSDSVYFVFDPDRGIVVEKKDLRDWGSVVRNGMVKAEDGTLYGVLSKAVFRIDTEECKVHLIAEPPCEITTGLAYLDHRLYYGAGSRLWSIHLV